MKFIRYCFILNILTLVSLTLLNESLSIEIETNNKLDELISSILANEQNSDFLPPAPLYEPIINKNIIINEFTPHQINININYPEISQAVIDNHIAIWAKNLSSNFVNNIKDIEKNDTKYTLEASYQVHRPSQFIISIVFTVGMYTGGAHGNTEIICLNYNLKTGKLLVLDEIFDDLKAALTIMSEFSYKKLQIELGEYFDEEMLKDGTSPIIENYATLSLVPEGINIYFQHYQVAPYAAGIKKVFMSLEELVGAKPSNIIWNINTEN